MSKSIKVKVHDGFNGDTLDLFAIERNDNIILTDHKAIYYSSGQFVNRSYKGTNQIVLPLRHNSSVIGIEVI